jgi:NSS family neurotransmitter:Na+ symporter
VQQYFQSFSADPVRPVFWLVVILLIAHFVIIHGVRGGIEKASKWMMPTLFVLLLVIVVASCMLPGAWKGVEFLFKPDFSKVSQDVFLGALGQSFYSMSIAMGCICTYASYYSRQTNLLHSALQVSFVDTLVAILAGLIIFPAAFSVGVNPDSGPSLIFITLPNVFNQAFSAVPLVGWGISILFYALLSLAALTSLMSLHEVAHHSFTRVAYIPPSWSHHRHRHHGHHRRVLFIVVGWRDRPYHCRQVAVRCVRLRNRTNLPTRGGFLTCIFLGWCVPRQLVYDEFTNWGTLSSRFLGVFLFLVRYVCPLAILGIFLNQLGLL